MTSRKWEDREYITPTGRQSRVTGFLKSGKPRTTKNTWGSSWTLERQRREYDNSPKLGDDKRG